VTAVESQPAAGRSHVQQVLAVAVQAGAIMLSSGAETARVEDTVNIMARAFGIAYSQCLVMTTGIYVSLDDPQMAHPVTLVHRVPSRTLHYARVSAVNDLSRRVAQGRVSVAEAQRELDAIARAPDPYTLPVWLAGGAASAAGVALLLGGGPLDVVPAFVSTVPVLLIGVLLQRSKIPALFSDALGAALATAVALALVALGVPIHADMVIAGGIMTLVPGAALLISVQDAISGNLLSAAARGLETLLKGAALACGVGVGLAGALNLGQQISVQSSTGQVWQMPIQVVAAFAASACYAVLNHVPRFALGTAGVAGAVGWLAYLLLLQVNAGPLAATFLAAFVVGVLSWGFARGQHAPVSLFILPGILPLLPGVTIYNGMLELATNQSLQGLLLLVHAVFLGGALAAGVGLSDSVAPHLWRRRLTRRRP
jgi:uncharacterized membrane protein YjjP (DUF1212 family)